MPTSTHRDRRGASPSVYVPRDGWLELLAGDDPALRDSRGRPLPTVISTAAGLDRTRLPHVVNGRLSLTANIMAACASLIERRLGIEPSLDTERTLFIRVPAAEAAARRDAQAVAA